MTYEQRVWSTQPLAFVCGADEAGRGPLAGPVVAAACVVLPPSLWEDARTLPLDGVRDSKTVGEEEREALFPVLLSHRALAFGVSVIDHHAIDRVNILAAAMLAMERAVAAARAEAARRVGAREPSGGAALPREDALDASLCVAPTPAKKGARAPLLHTVFIDGPRCPTRVAAAAEGIVGAWNVDGYTGADAGAGAGAGVAAAAAAVGRAQTRRGYSTTKTMCQVTRTTRSFCTTRVACRRALHSLAVVSRRRVLRVSTTVYGCGLEAAASGVASRGVWAM